MSSDGEGKVIFSKPLLQDFYEGSLDAMDLSEKVGVCAFVDGGGAKPCRQLQNHDAPAILLRMWLAERLLGLREEDHMWHLVRWG